MTIEELKKEADKLGYRLCKKTKYIKFLPCRCGKKYPEVWFTYNGVFYQCPKCGARSKVGKTEREARINWNKGEQQ